VLIGVCFWQVYNLTAGKSFPVWTTPEQRKKLAKDESYRSRVMVLQDFDMPQASQKMRITRDERHLFVSGTYKPRLVFLQCAAVFFVIVSLCFSIRIKCYEVAELSCKFERAVEEEIVDFELLTDDFSKLCLLGASNTVTFHAKYGHYHSTRLAAPARSLRYDRATCDL
jgi:ribosome biogenesis protein ENP2